MPSPSPRPNPSPAHAAPLLKRQALSYRTLQGQRALPKADTQLDLAQTGGEPLVIPAEKGISYTLTDPVTGKVIEVHKVERIGKSLHITLHDEQHIELQDFFVNASAPDGAPLAVAQAQFVFYTGSAACLYGIVDELAHARQWGPIEGSHTLWSAEDGALCPLWATASPLNIAPIGATEVGALPYLSDAFLAAAALLSIGGRAASTVAAAVADLIITGNITLGPVLANNDLRVTAYDATGHALSSPATVDQNGNYSITIQGGHQGVVTVRLTSAGDALDYVSGAPIVGSDVSQDLRGKDDLGAGVLLATGVAPGTGKTIINITPVTDIASRLLVTDTTAGAPTLKTGYGSNDVSTVNKQVAGEYLGDAAKDANGNLQEIIALGVRQTTVNQNGDANANPSTYGLELHDLAQLAALRGNLSEAQQIIQSQISYDSTNKAISVSGISIAGGEIHAPITHPENDTGTVTQVQLDSTTGYSNIRYTITGGTDARQFTLDETTGALHFNTAPDFEAPADVDHNNSYQVIVTAWANNATGDPLTDTQLLNITVTDLPETAPVVSTQVAGVLNLDVRSKLVLQFDTAVQLSTDSQIHIRIVHDGGAGFHADGTWAAQVAAGERDIDIAITDTRQLSLSADGRSLIIHPAVNLDFGSQYHIEVDAGAFSRQTGSAPASAAITGDSALHFGTVTPGQGADTSAAAPSQAMTDSGALSASYAYWDIQGLGQFHAPALGPFDLAGHSIALAYKDCDANGASQTEDLTYSGIGVGNQAFNLQLSHFGADDLIYFDDQRTGAAQVSKPKDTGLLELAQGLAANGLAGQSADDVLNLTQGALQVDPAVNPTDPSQSGEAANNGAGLLGIQSWDSGYTYQPATAVISA